MALPHFTNLNSHKYGESEDSPINGITTNINEIGKMDITAYNLHSEKNYFNILLHLNGGVNIDGFLDKDEAVMLANFILKQINK